jgi:hypothetical protein
MATPLKTGLERVRHGDPEPAPCASEGGRSGTRNEHGKRKQYKHQGTSWNCRWRRGPNGRPRHAPRVTAQLSARCAKFIRLAGSCSRAHKPARGCARTAWRLASTVTRSVSAESASHEALSWRAAAEVFVGPAAGGGAGGGGGGSGRGRGKGACSATAAGLSAAWTEASAVTSTSRPSVVLPLSSCKGGEGQFTACRATASVGAASASAASASAACGQRRVRPAEAPCRSAATRVARADDARHRQIQCTTKCEGSENRG